LGALSQGDQAIVGRALSKDPRERYPSCLAFIQALESISPPPPRSPRIESTRPLAKTAPESGARTPPFAAPGDPKQGAVAATDRIDLGSAPGAAGAELGPPSTSPSNRQAQEGPLPGYRLQECLGRGPTGELWRAIGPRQENRQVRFLTIDEKAQQAGGSPLERLFDLRHEGLPALELVKIGSDRVALISEAGESSLQARLKECQAVGMSGIPRVELLACLARVADHLDRLYHLAQLQHLTLTPRHLAISGARVLLLDFGLAELLWMPAGLQPAALNPRYSAVELFEGILSDACDQYSLALIYQEMLVGLHPFRNLNARQMASSRQRGQPDVSLLPGLDRPIVLQALDPVPENRFRSCREMIQALEQVTTPGAASVVPPGIPLVGRSRPSSGRVALPSVISSTAQTQPTADTNREREEVSIARQAIDELVAAAALGQEIRTSGEVFYRVAPGRHIEHRCWARQAVGMTRLKVEAFRDEWRGERIAQTESRITIAVRTNRSLLQRCLGRVPGLVVDVCLGGQRDPASNQTPIRITIKPTSCSRAQGEQLLMEVGPALVTSLQTHVNSQADRADQERFPLTQNVSVYMVASKQTIQAQSRDIGRAGMCLCAPVRCEPGAVTLTLTRRSSAQTVQVSGWVRDSFPTRDGRFEVEVEFSG
jgi:hypothetical protein